MDKKVVIFTHMPCSSGTYYTSYISNIIRKNSWIIDETSPNKPDGFGLKSFGTSVPLLRECLRGRIDLEYWKSCYKEQIKTIHNQWLASDSNLLALRCHAWTDIQTPQNERISLSKLLEELGISHSVIYTHRDPIDTWLGFRASFHETSRHLDFNMFCSLYRQSVSEWNSCQDRALVVHIKTESLATADSAKELNKLSHLNISLDYDSSIHAKELGSGASGRKFTRPIIPARRPYSMRLTSEAQNSIAYEDLCQELNYTRLSLQKQRQGLLAQLFHASYQKLLEASINDISLGTFAAKAGFNLAFY